MSGLFEDLGIAEIDIHGRLQDILAKVPTVAVPIDSLPLDLQSWAGTLRFPVKSPGGEIPNPGGGGSLFGSRRSESNALDERRL